MANDDDDFGQDWEELCRAQKYDFQSYVSVDRHVATSGVETVEELCKAQGVWRKKMKKMEMNKRWCQASPRLMKVYKKLKHFSMRELEATGTVKIF
jgi:hypothetical protein